MSKERKGWAEETATRLRRASANKKRVGVGAPFCVVTEDAGFITLAFLWAEIDAQTDEQLAKLVKCRVEQQKRAILEREEA